MNIDKEFDRALRDELGNTVLNSIWKNDDGTYEAFGNYKIVPTRPHYQVIRRDIYIGTFSTTRSALSWCIADKFNDINLAAELMLIDSRLYSLTSDINSRANLADKSTKVEFRELIGTKLESKIIQKKTLENQLAKCVSSAKYLQQRGFNNETARTGRSQPNKASR
jgi:hypothetical protein